MSARRLVGWRSTLTARLLAGELVITVALVAGVAGFLLISRSLQTDTAVRSEASNRSATGFQLLQHVTEPQTQFSASTLARANSVKEALALPDASGRAAALATVFDSGLAGALSSGGRVAVFDSTASPVYTEECGAGVTAARCEASAGAHLSATTPTVALAMSEGARPACAASPAIIAHQSSLKTTCPPGYEGTELVGRSLPSFDAAVTVRDSAQRFLGVVVYSSTLQAQFRRFGSALLYTPVLLTTGPTPLLFRFDPARGYASSQSAADPLWGKVLAQRPTSFAAQYSERFAGSVAASYLALSGPAPGAPAYIGVEVPESVFAGQTGADERTIVLIGITAIVLVFLLIAGFASRFVVGPIARLERGVRRIASGDLASDIPVTSDDELGRLAASVNRMRGQIAGYIGHLDASIERLESVSHALTATGEGVEALQASVLAAAAAIGGAGAESTLLSVHEGTLRTLAVAAQPAAVSLDDEDIDTLMDGAAVRRVPGDVASALLAVPMTYHGRIQGALAVRSATVLSDSDQRALTALANNASVAIENTRLFDQERETVHRLRELDVMKTNFLTTTQHELRTPVLAIKGEIELVTTAWQQLDEPTRLDLVRDMEVSARLLGDIVENIVVFALLNSEAITLETGHVDTAAAINASSAELRDNYREGLPVELVLRLEPRVAIIADRERFEQVMRALLDNAVKFTPAGGTVTVTSKRVRGMCRIEVIDDGIGIEAHELPTIFDHLRQVDGSRTRRYGGMGMGLALVRRLCEAHGARASVTSTAGRGTHFTMEWPLATERRQALPARAG